MIMYPPSVAERISGLVARYSDPAACVAHQLCDRHHATRRAYRIVAADLTVQDLSYGELRAESEKFAAALHKLGIRQGDRVATLMGKSRDYLITVVGIWRLGAVHVPLFTAFAPPAIAFRLMGSQAKAVVCDPEQFEKLQAGEAMPAQAPWQVIVTAEGSPGAMCLQAMLDEQSPGFPAALVGGSAPMIHVYTSGTTGNPKGVVVPVRALAAFHAYAEFGLDLRETDTFWCAADPGWAYGLYFGIINTLQTGVPSILVQANFAPELAMSVLAQERVTNFSAAPTLYRALCTGGFAMAEGQALRCATSAGEPLTPEVNQWAKTALGVLVHDHYGQTEAGMLVNNHHHPQAARPIKDRSMGQQMPGWAAVILHQDRDEELGPGQPGRLAMRLAESPLAWFRGYDGDAGPSAEKITEDGRYYLTGDTAQVDAQGYITFAARDDDVIIMAGYRIGPFEVESSLALHPAVAESAVIAVPDAMRGEVIEAYVVLRDGAAGSTELASELQQWVKRNFAAHAYPRAVHFIAAMPKTPSGKIQRYLLKQRRRDELGHNAA